MRGRRALDADRDDVAHAPVGLVARLVLDRADAAGDVVARLLLDAREQRLAGLRLGHRGDALELALLRLDELRRARLALAERRVALGDAALARRDVGGELVELGRARAEPLLGARDLEAAALELLLDLAAGREHVLLGGDLRLLAHGVRLAARAGELALGLRRAAPRPSRRGCASRRTRAQPRRRVPQGRVLRRACRSPRAGRRAPCGPVQSCLCEARRQVAGGMRSGRSRCGAGERRLGAESEGRGARAAGACVTSANDRMSVQPHRRASPRPAGARPVRPRMPAERAESSRERAAHHDRGRPDDARGVDALPGRRAAAPELRRALRPLEDGRGGRARRLSAADAHHRPALGLPHAALRRAPHGARGVDRC